jgi:hypothetical protein
MTKTRAMHVMWGSLAVIAATVLLSQGWIAGAHTAITQALQKGGAPPGATQA